MGLGCGLPPGPGGSLGALEGVSYLTLLGLTGWSIGMKATTSKGLPPGAMHSFAGTDMRNKSRCASNYALHKYDRASADSRV